MFVRHAVIVTAAGSSVRFNESSDSFKKKEFLEIDGQTILSRSVSAFLQVPNLAAVFVTYKSGLLERTKDILSSLTSSTDVPFFFVEGGSTRQMSVFNALKALYAENETLKAEVVSIHDGARPCITKDLIMDCIAYAKLFGAAVPSLKVNDTLVRVDEDGFISSYIDRSDAYTVQTPQVFRFPDIFNAHVAAIRDGKTGCTDDTSVFIANGGKVAAVRGDERNIKITYEKDIERLK